MESNGVPKWIGSLVNDFAVVEPPKLQPLAVRVAVTPGASAGIVEGGWLPARNALALNTLASPPSRRPYWGRHWQFIIQCTPSPAAALRKPFRISDVQVSGTNYAQGGTIFKVEPEDERYLRAHGSLEAIDEDAV